MDTFVNNSIIVSAKVPPVSYTHLDVYKRQKHGLEVDSLDKKSVKELLKTAPPELAEVLELRRQLAKSSVKKYQAMQNACLLYTSRCV